jgi:hypothetical protein
MVVEDLKQGVEHADMGLLYLIKEDRIVQSPHLFGQLPTLFTAGITSVIGKKIQPMWGRERMEQKTIDVVDDRVLGKAPRRDLSPAERPELRRGDSEVHPVAPGTRAGGQHGEVPEEGLSLERAPGEGRVHRCPGRAITDADVLGTLLVQNPSLRVLSMGAPTLAPPPKTPRVLSPARPSLHSSNTPLFSCWSRIACAREGTGVRTRQDAETRCTITQGHAHDTAGWVTPSQRSSRRPR